MAAPKKRRAQIYRKGEGHNAQGDAYTYGSTGAKRPEKYDTYVVDGTSHRFDGKCHADCEDVR